MPTTLTGDFIRPPSGTTEPSSGLQAGDLFFNTDEGVLKFYDGTSWLKVASEIAIISSITGTLYAAQNSTLTINGSGFGVSGITVKFTHSGTDYTVTGETATDGGTVVVVDTPSGLESAISYNDTVGVTLTNSDGIESNSISLTVDQLPSGGTVYTDGNDRIHVFKSSGTFAHYGSRNVSYLVVAGGGGGSSDDSGGAGAGGVRNGTTPVSTTSYPVVVGGGGARTPNGSSANGSNGGTSSAFGISNTGGGGGGFQGAGGNPGGSGGGGGHGPTAPGGAGTPGQGFPGGIGYGQGDPWAAAGGGGKSQAGYAGQNNTNNSGRGGDGSNYNGIIPSSIATSASVGEVSGSSVYFGGGGGGQYRPGFPGSNVRQGGLGGGGNGGAESAAENGQAYTGGGGGGGANGPTVYLGGNGGSGVVIVRYTV